MRGKGRRGSRKAVPNEACACAVGGFRPTGS